jgi:large subunit ribosomal protein L4
MFTLPILNQEGKEVERIELDAKVFDGKIKSGVLYQAITAYRANQRTGFAATKTRGEVSGGGRKPWRQKGTGRARVGSIRSPLWRHGGVIFGPHPRDHSYSIPQKAKSEALKSALNAKLNDDAVVIVEDIKLSAPKTKELAKVLTSLKSRSRTLLLLDRADKNLHLAANNIQNLVIQLAGSTNAYEVLKAHKVIISKDGLKVLAERLKNR